MQFIPFPSWFQQNLEFNIAIMMVTVCSLLTTCRFVAAKGSNFVGRQMVQVGLYDRKIMPRQNFNNKGFFTCAHI